MAFSDSDYAGDVEGRKSTSGAVLCLGKAPIHWFARRQNCVATSTAQAEYHALATTAMEYMWLRNILVETDEYIQFCEQLDGSYRRMCMDSYIVCDNRAALAIAGNPLHFKSAKHIEVRFHYVRDCVGHGFFLLASVSSEDNIADVMTKSVPRDRQNWSIDFFLLR